MQMMYPRHRLIASCNPAWRPMLVALLALTWTCIPAHGQALPEPLEQHSEEGPLQMSVAVDRDRVLVAQPLVLTLTITAPRQVQVRLPDVVDRLGDFDVVNMRSFPAVPDGDKRRWIVRYELESIQTGPTTIPPITLVYTDQRDAEAVAMGEAHTPVLHVQVASLLEETADPRVFRDIKGPLDLPVVDQRHFWRHPLVLVTLGVLVLGLLALATFVCVRRRQSPVTAHETALQALARLADDLPGDAAQAQQFYYRLTDIVRHYFQATLALPVTTRTSREFLEQLGHRDMLPQATRQKLAAFLEAADMVKYARMDPGRQIAAAAVASGRELVEEARRDAQAPRASEVQP